MGNIQLLISNNFKANSLFITLRYFLVIFVLISCKDDDTGSDDNRLEGPLWTQIRTQFTECAVGEDNTTRELECDGSNCFTVRFLEGNATFTELEKGLETVSIFSYVIEENRLIIQGLSSTFRFNGNNELIISSEGNDGCTLLETWIK